MNEKKLFILTICIMTLLSGCMSFNSSNNGNGNDDADDEIIPYNCSEDELKYYVGGTPIEFCFRKEWGEPEVEEDDTASGSISRVRFTGANEGILSPGIQYESLDYAPLDHGFGTFCFDCLDLSSSDDEIIEIIIDFYEGTVMDPAEFESLLEEKGVDVVKTTVSGKAAIFSEGLNGDVYYFIPNAFDGYHMIIYADEEILSDLNKFINKIKF